MNRSRMVASGLMVALGIAVASQLWAFPEFARETKAACATCHLNVAGGADLNDQGKLFKDDGTAPGAAAAKTANYVGTTKCRMCHIKQYKAWLETPHAKAWAALTKGDPKKVTDMAAALKIEIKGSPDATDACVKCHVVGFQLTGGYPQADSAKTAVVMNVGCEACHGPGSLHVTAPLPEKKKFINKAVAANLCKQCHTADTSPKFEFADFVKRGVHATK